MDNRRLLLAVGLSMAVLMIWGALFPAKRSAPQEPVAGSVVAERTQPPLSNDKESPGADLSGSSSGENGLAPTLEPPVEGAAEERFTLESEIAVAEFSSRGAQLVSYRLKGHASSDGGVLDLVRRRGMGPYPFGLVGRDGSPLPVNEALFQGSESAEAPRGLEFLYRGDKGAVSKRFWFTEEGLLQLEVEASGIERGWAVLVGPGIGNPTAEETKSSLAKRGAVYSVAGGFSSVPSQSTEEPELISGGGLGWAGLDDNYFLAVVLPGSDLAEVKFVPGFFEGVDGDRRGFRQLPQGDALKKEQKAQIRDFALEIRPAGEKLTATAYMGPKELNRLLSLGRGLDRTIQLGWFRFLALPFMHALQWIYNNVVGNYGWAIVLMTTLIKILLLPLTHSTMVSMGKMQELAPKMQAIRGKYASKMRDKQGRPNFETQKKINEETMALYKSEGVNPAGGCLPMVLQLPVFIAFYNILPASIELRQAHWIGWVKDLSAHDPLYLLPIVMGATQLGQMLMTPATGNPMQRRLMLMMPVVFTVMFLGFPSGLVLYWLTNNVLSIVQQTVYNRLKRAAPQKTA